jgi:hypothetical protein
MTAYTLKSSNKAALVAEMARVLIQAESSLTTPIARLSLSFGAGILTIQGFVQGVSSIKDADGTIGFAAIDHTPGDSVVLTGTSLADRGINSLAEAMVAACVDLNAAEDTYLATPNRQLPNGVNMDISIAGALATINATLPFTVSLNTAGAQVITVTDYLA